MFDLTIEQINRIIQLCKDRVAANGIASVAQVALDHKEELGIYGIELSQVEIIANILIRDDPRYSIFRDGNRYKIVLNSNYELTESVIQTNENVRKTNNLTWVIAGVAATFALGSFLTDLLKSDKQLRQELKQIDTTLQKQSQSLDSLGKTIKSLSLSQRDSLEKK